MPESIHSDFGDRLRIHRNAARLTRKTLAQRAGISFSYLDKLELGERKPTAATVDLLARELGIDPDKLDGDTARRKNKVHDQIPALRTVLDFYDDPDDGPVRPLAILRSEVIECTALRIDSRYGHLIDKLLGLIPELSRARQQVPERQREQVEFLLAHAYRSADGVAYKHGYIDLSGRILEVMRRPVEAANDPLLQASAAYVRTEIYFANKNLSIAQSRLETAIGTMPKATSELATAIRGSLHMRAAVVAARAGEPSDADLHMDYARRYAENTTEGIYYGTAFGPSSVHTHHVATAIELDEFDKAVQLARSWTASEDIPAERLSHYHIDLAVAYLWTGNQVAAVQAIQEAKAVAPEHVKEHPRVKEVLTRLARGRRSLDGELLTLARWAGIV
ncbi:MULTISPECIES: helix-turn-helix domain-containing protein [unclassified Crossiella]|uniref:helix-turn-helix domain-containing protein n=1 Tax=unclassified Crossiella TaxID=2620835 RepID=UPI001FFF55AD|nr:MULTISPECIES: helix-turn-helix transcriptional regulator [unclassified Crossiella]MCK2245260.1 helix-turn-helix domain-containing protein [Crossiella sp. S99.2]MCK2258913.1 helix-turn-helix domain-containing protein [Crossiella sp. S99.1]